MYDARQIANWFIERAAKDERVLSVMSLLKLVYIAHGWYLESYNEPLIRNEIRAWKYGPVTPDVYYGFKQQGVEVKNRLLEFEPIEDESVIKFLEQVYDTYGRLSPSQLSYLTYELGNPWKIATERGGRYAPIPDGLIKKHYAEKRRLWENEEKAGEHYGV